MNDTIPYGRQWIDDDDVAAVVRALRSDWLTQGPRVAEFEEALAAYVGARYAVAVSSGTAALHLAYLAAGAGPGDHVVTTPMTFAATANAALYCGVVPRFADIDRDTWDIDSDALAAACTPHTRVVVPVHFGGLPCEMEAASAVAGRAGALVVEDACHALGATWRDAAGVEHRVGDCSHSAMAVFSFHPVKHITTGEGGAITTNDPEMHRRLVELRQHGVTKDPVVIGDKPGWYYEMTELGFNYRLTDLACALGTSQLAKAEGWLARRREIVARYDEAFVAVEGVVSQRVPQGRDSAWHLYAVEVSERDRVYEALRARGVGTQVHYIPVHLHAYYQRFGFERGAFPNAEAHFDRCLSLPLFPKMTDDEVSRVIAAVSDVVREG